MTTNAARFLVLAAVGAAAVVTAAGATAANINVSGTQTVVNQKKGIFKMHGSLLGDWNTLSFKPQSMSPTQIVANGRERFVGCIDSNRNVVCDAGEPSGSLNFVYIVWTEFNPTTKKEIRGQCLHPVTGGTGDFAHALGVIHMTDTATRTTYEGRLTFGATAAERVPTSALAGC